MDTFALLPHGLAGALQPTNLLDALIGVTLGTAVGVLPGIGPALTGAKPTSHRPGAASPAPPSQGRPSSAAARGLDEAPDQLGPELDRSHRVEQRDPGAALAAVHHERPPVVGEDQLLVAGPNQIGRRRRLRLHDGAARTGPSASRDQGNVGSGLASRRVTRTSGAFVADTASAGSFVPSTR